MLRSVKLVVVMMMSLPFSMAGSEMANEGAFSTVRLMEKSKSGKLEAPTATLEVSEGVMKENLEISLSSIGESQLPKLDRGMTNVTDSFSGYRFLPHGEHFGGKGAKVVLGYDRTKIPSGYTEDDIRTYYYDEQQGHWIALQRDSVDRAHRVIVSHTTHFTDMINGVIQAPESPETQGFAPTMMSDLQAADPTTKVQMIEAPQANSSGTASLSYSLEMPPARNGMAPNLSIQYSSDAGSGWLGEGWNLTTSSISVDTRWGVPRYNPGTETETYVMDGQMLLEDGIGLAHRNLGRERKNGKVRFYPRKENAFSEIVRIGDKPSNYIWEVTDRRGTKYTYGAYKITETKDEYGDVTKDTTIVGVVMGNNQYNEKYDTVISEWRLTRIEEIHGDYVEYKYRTEFEQGAGGLYSTALYLDSVVAGNAGEAPHTVVVLKNGEKKNIKRTDARYGYLTSSNQLLGSVDIYFEGKYLRGYKFDYTSGLFGVNLLRGISQLDSKKNVFTSHKLNYNKGTKNSAGDELQKKESEYDPFFDGAEKTLSCSTSNNNFIEKLASLINNVTGSNITALGGNSSVSGSFNTYVGGGLGDYSPTKSMTGGVSYTHGRTESNGVSSFIDLNGDGLPDKVFVRDDRVYYMAQKADGTFEKEEQVEGISSISHSVNKSNGFGGKVHLGWGPAIFVGGADYNSSESETDVYFSDVNSDGFVDLVDNGRVYFNRLVNGKPFFKNTSEGTANPLHVKGKIELSYDSDNEEENKELQEQLKEKQNQKAQESPLQDIVRVWCAPFDGTVKIGGTVKLVSKNGATPSDNRDGVFVSIQKNDEYVMTPSLLKWNENNDESGNENTDASGSCGVKKGDKIYFRVQSGNHIYANGEDDVVLWTPTVTYTEEKGVDPEGKSYGKYSVADQLLFTASSVAIVDSSSKNGTPVYESATLQGRFKKPLLSDDVVARVILYSDSLLTKKIETVDESGNPKIIYEEELNADFLRDTIYNHTFAWNEEADEDIDLGGIDLLSYRKHNDKTGHDVFLSNVVFELHSNTNVAVEDLSWNPSIHYVSSDGESDKDEKMIVSYTHYSNGVNHVSSPYVLPNLDEKAVDSLRVCPVLKRTDKDYTVRLSLKGTDKERIASYTFKYNTQSQSFDPPFVYPYEDLTYEPGKKVWFEFYYDFDDYADENAQLRFYVDTIVSITEDEAGNEVVERDNVYDETFSVNMYSKVSDNGFGPLYKGWGMFAYSATGKERCETPIKTNELGLQVLIDMFKPDADGNLPKKEDGTTYGLDDMTFVPLRPDAETQSWVGQDPNCYICADSMCSSRLGEQHVIVEDPLKKMQEAIAAMENGNYEKGSPAFAIPVLSESSSNTEMLGGGAFGVNLTGSKCDGKGGATQIFTDLNGDGYPDIVTSKKVQYTNALGGFDGKNYKGNCTDYSISDALTFGLGGMPQHYEPNGGKSAGGRAENNGNKVQLNAISFNKAQASVSANVNAYAYDETHFTMVDMNGDGLPDKVALKGAQLSVAYNTGYSFVGPFPFDAGFIKKSNSSDKGLGVCVDIGASSFSAGISVNRTDASTEYDMRDVNGDGLPDLVKVDGANSKVRFNTGNGFTSPYTWSQLNQLSSTSSTSASTNANATVSVTVQIVMVPVKFSGSGGGSVGFGLSGEHFSYQDVDGDGFADMVSSNDFNNMRVRYSRIGAANKLESVINPFGGKFTIEYAHTTPTTDHPGGKWAMSALTVDDATGMNPVMKTTFNYENGKRDRCEREFLGFGKVTTTNLDEQGNPVRSVIAEYDVQHYLTAGAPIHNLVVSPGTETDEQGNLVDIKHKEDITSYAHYSVTNGSQLKEVNISDFTKETSLFSAPKAKKAIAYEYHKDETNKGVQDELELSSETYDYTENYGNLSAYSFRDLTNKTDNGFVGYDDTIQYSNQKLGLATSVEVKGTDGTLYRKVTAEYKDKRTPTAMTQMVQHLDGDKKAVFNFKYDQYGNMVRRTFPTEEMNSKKEIEPAKDSSFFEYEYDRKYHMYPERVTDAFGYRSEMEDYDYRYGIPRTVRDMNGYTVRYHIDDLGRTDTIVAPNEQSDGVPYTIAYKYVLDKNMDYKSSYAVTNHYDPQHPNNPLQTVTHVDGLGRPFQVKKDAEIHGKGEKMIVSGRTQYDALGRTIATYLPDTCKLADATKIVGFNDKLLNSSTFDAIDRPLTQTLPGDESGDEDLNLKGVSSVTEMSYSIEDGLMKTTSIDPKDNEQYAYTNGAGKTVRTARNYQKMEGEDFESMEEKVYAINYVYDPIGQLLSVTDAGGNETSYTYDMAGCPLSVKHPSAGLTTFVYDVAGNMVKKQTPNLVETNKFVIYKYVKNRLEVVEYPNHPWNNVTYTYGGVNAPHNRVGRVALVEDGSGATELFYGRMGEVTKQRRTLVIPNQAVATYTTEWTYDSHNRLQTMTYPDGEVVSYRYNLGGLLSSVSGKKDFTYNYVEEIGYDKYEQRKYLKYGNGVETNYGYSKERRRLDTLIVSNQEGEIMNNAYFYDNLDNITKLVNTAVAQKTKDGKTIGGGVTHNYTYDAWNRLVKASGTFSGAEDKSAKYDLFMAYDELYNVTSKKLNVEQTNLQFPGTLKAGHTLKYQYDRENNDPFRLLSVSASEYRVAVEEGEDPEALVDEDKMVKTRSEYAFDANGNQTQVATGKEAKEGVEELPQANLRQLHWDENNRLLAINDNGHVSSYFYDANGERTVKMSAGMEDLFINGSRPVDKMEFDAKFVAYVSPYLVLKNGGEYTKHIYVGKERIASKIGDFESFGADPRRVEKAGESIRKINYKDKYDALGEQLAENYDTFKVACNLKENEDYEDNASFCCGDKPLDQMEGNDPSSVMENTKAEANIFFYHPDHLGSTSLVTNFDGEVTQHVAYIPYGEVFIEERNGVWNTPYLFNAKELDEETGLYYYGARYLNPKDARWLSVDPMFEKYIGMSPYNYCLNNPVKLIDPDGNATYGMESEDGTVSYVITENKVDKNGNVCNPEVYTNEYGQYRLIDDSYSAQTEDGQWKQVPKEKKYDQEGGYFLFGSGTNMSEYTAKHVYNSIDMSTFPGAAGGPSLPNAGNSAGRLINMFAHLFKSLYNGYSDAQRIRSIVNKDVLSGSGSKEVEPQEEPSTRTNTQTTYIYRKIGRGKDNWPIYAVDTLTVVETVDMNNKVISRDSTFKPNPTPTPVKK